MTPRVSLRHALSDPDLLGEALGGPTWAAWRSILLAAMGEALDDEELALFRSLTGRTVPPSARVEELWGIVGRRGGKTKAMAVLASYLACLCDWRDRLTVGERGVVLLIAPDQRQATIALDYASGLIEAMPMLAQLLMNRTVDTLSLRNGIDLEVRSSSFRRLRGLTCVAVLADEAAFYMAEGSSNPDAEILNAVRPSLSTTAGLLAVISSPYGKKGVLWEAYRQHYGPDGDPAILVAQGASRDFNPSLPVSIVERAIQRDSASASAEYLGRFRDDVQGYVSPEVVARATATGVIERPPERGVTYHCGLDPSGGVKDSFSAAICHREAINGQDVAVLDLLVEHTAPFVPAEIVSLIAREMRRYGCRTARMDRYAAAWPEQEFRKAGITTRPTDTDRSGLYANLLPMLNSGQVLLLDSPRLAAQLVSLERRTGRGRDIIDHPPNGSDDVANAVAIAVGMALRKPVRDPLAVGGVCVGPARVQRGLGADFYNFGGGR